MSAMSVSLELHFSTKIITSAIKLYLPRDKLKWQIQPLNSLTAGAAYIRVFIFISTLSTTF